MVWNYRGYSQSQGSPSPNALVSDGEIVVDWLRSEMKVKLLGIHGESLGGFVAANIAKNKQLDFLCSDRTFTCVPDVVRYSFPKGFAFLFRLFTGWELATTNAYMDFTGYKLVTYDPKDDIIPTLASLQHGIVVQQVIGSDQKKGFWCFKNDKQIQSVILLCIIIPGIRIILLQINFIERRI